MRVAVGCSYTAGVGVDTGQSYPCVMGYENWAEPGTDIEYALWCAHRAVRAGAEHILFQITSWDRITLTTANTTNFAKNRPYTGEPTPTHYTIADYLADDDHIKWLYEHHVMSNWRTENLAQRMHELSAFAHNKGCTVTYYDWLPRHNIQPHPLVQQLLPETSVLDWLGQDYFVDEFYHINAQGHALVATEYFK